MGTKAEKASKQEVEGVIFKVFSNGVSTNRDAWAYNFDDQQVAKKVKLFIEIYNTEVDRWNNRIDKQAQLDDFVLTDETKIKWSSRLKECLLRGQKAQFAKDKIRHSLYRPFTVQYLFFDEVLTHRQGQFPKMFPTSATENEKQVICLGGVGSSKPFQTLMVNLIPCMDLLEKTQCFPFYTYAEDGSNRQENLTDWALTTFQQHYQDTNITKWDIFYYVYGLLHHPGYREKYAANLKRELPRIPPLNSFLAKEGKPDSPFLAKEGQTDSPRLTKEGTQGWFWAFAKAGQQLADLHLHYENQPEYPLRLVTQEPLDWRVEKMKLFKDQTSLLYNDSLTFTGIPPETFEYRLGHRSALEWVIDQYQVSQDKRSGIVNDPNRLDEERYIARLIGQVATVSVKTVAIVKELPEISRSAADVAEPEC